MIHSIKEAKEIYFKGQLHAPDACNCGSCFNYFDAMVYLSAFEDPIVVGLVGLAKQISENSTDPIAKTKAKIAIKQYHEALGREKE